MQVWFGCRDGETKATRARDPIAAADFTQRERKVRALEEPTTGGADEAQHVPERKAQGDAPPPPPVAFHLNVEL